VIKVERSVDRYGEQQAFGERPADRVIGQAQDAVGLRDMQDALLAEP